MGRERMNHIRKRLRKMPLGVLAIKCVETVRQKTLRKNPLTCISNQMGRESLIGKLSRGIFLGHITENFC